MLLIDEQLDKELSAFICAWDDFEKSTGGEDIIDMNLSGHVAGKKYQNRKEILKDIEYFLSLSEVKAHSVIYRKMTAHHYFLRQVMNNDIPFDEYFENTMGLKPVIFTPEKIAGLQEQTKNLLAQSGFEYHTNVVGEIMSSDLIKPSNKTGELLNETHKAFYQWINTILDLNATFDIEYSFLPEGHHFWAWISGDGRNFSVRLNKQRVNEYSISNLKRLATHELTAHAVQASILRTKVERGKIPRYLGYITTHESFQFSSEGLASTLIDFYPDEFASNKAIKLIQQIVRLDYVVYSNAAIRFCRGEPREECIDYAMKNCTFRKEEVARRLEYLLSNKPIGFGYRQVYGVAIETFLEIKGSYPDKNKFVKSVYEDFLMPDQILAMTKRPVADFV